MFEIACIRTAIVSVSRATTGKKHELLPKLALMQLKQELRPEAMSLDA